MTAGKRSLRRSAWVAVAAMTLTAAAVVPSVLLGQDAAPKRPAEDMTAMGRAYRTLGQQIKDATKNESSLQILAQLETSSISAKGAIPPTISALPEADRAAKLADYKKEMIKLIRQELDAEEALLANDNDKAATAVAAMMATENEGHQAYRGRGGRRGGGGGAPGGPGAGAPPAQ